METIIEFGIYASMIAIFVAILSISDRMIKDCKNDGEEEIEL